MPEVFEFGGKDAFDGADVAVLFSVRYGVVVVVNAAGFVSLV